MPLASGSRVGCNILADGLKACKIRSYNMPNYEYISLNARHDELLDPQ